MKNDGVLVTVYFLQKGIGRCLFDKVIVIEVGEDVGCAEAVTDYGAGLGDFAASDADPLVV